MIKARQSSDVILVSTKEGGGTKPRKWHNLSTEWPFEMILIKQVLDPKTDNVITAKFNSNLILLTYGIVYIWTDADPI